ncbi:MAG: restriction endonuclease subunit S [Bacteroidales bacterium]|nr:restriction endonuclease subunit S [Bacteroidales bacterium]
MPYSVPQNIDPNKIFLVNFSELEGRWDPTIFQNQFRFISKQYTNRKLSSVALIEPKVSFSKLKDDDDISFIPMNIVNEDDGTIKESLYKKVLETKGFTRFQDGDLIWAKITPCMQNGKSAVVRKLRNGYGCGSTEFFVIRPKDDTLLIDYVYILLRDNRILQTATNYFGGSAGQQRVSKTFLENLTIPVPPLHIQLQIVNVYNAALSQRKKKLSESKAKLASIDKYLLDELGITLPEDSHEKTFIVNYKDVDGGRLDPKSYCNNVKNLKNAITDSSFEKQPLSTFIVNESSGDWGEDIERKDLDFANYTKCLVLRATEFDNRYNLKLDNSRVKYRYISNAKLRRMNIQTNDLIIEKSGGSEDQPVGRIGILTREILGNKTIAFSNFLHKITVTGIDPQYLFFYLKTMHNIGLTDSMQSQTNGIRNLIMSEYKRQNIIVPDKQAQNQIVDHISAIRAEAKALEQEADAILEQAKKEVEGMILG